MKTNPTILLILTILFVSNPLIVLSQKLPTRSASYVLTEKQWEEFQKRWEQEGKPTFAFSVGYADLPNAQGDPRVISGNLLANSIKSLITTNLDSRAVTDTKQSSRLNQRSASRIALATGGGNSELEAAYKSEPDSDITVSITMAVVDRKLIPTTEFMDNRSASIIASPTTRPIDPNVNNWEYIYGNAILKKFVEAYASDARKPYVPRYEFAFSGFTSYWDAEEFVTEMEILMEEGEHGSIEYDVRPIAKDNFSLDVTLTSDLYPPARFMRRFTLRLRKVFMDDVDLVPVESSRFRMTALIASNEAPEWYRMTDANGALENKSQFVDAFRGQRLGVLVGRGIENDWPQLEIQGVPDKGEGLPFSPAELRTEMQNYFMQLGFDVRDDGAVRARLQKLGRILDRQGLSAINTEALGDTDAFDLLAVITLRQNSKGEVQVNARMISRSNAQILGGLVGPTALDKAMGKYRVMTNDPNNLGRYVAGSLATRVGKTLQYMEQTIDVNVVNLENTQILRRIFDLAQSVEGVKSASRLVMTIPVGSFELSIEKDQYETVLLNLEKKLISLGSSPVIASSTRSSILIDAAPEVNAEPPTGENLTLQVDAYRPPFPEYVYVPPVKAVEVSSVIEPVRAIPDTFPAIGFNSLSDNPQPRQPEHQPNAWAILIGVNQSPGNKPLAAAASDAKNLAVSLVNDAGFPAQQVFLMTDEQAGSSMEPTSQNIIDATNTIVKHIQSKGGDPSEHTVLISISTHGGADPEKGTTRLSTRDGFVELEMLRSILTKGGVGESFFFVDACHAGGPNDVAFIESLKVSDQTTLAGCRRNQYSREVSGPPPFGLFTRGVIFGLQDGAADRLAGNSDNVVDLFELYKFVYQTVVEASNGEQHPFLKVVTGDIPVIARY